MQRDDLRLIRLPEEHGWRARPGYSIFVAEQGAVRFDFPEEWVTVRGQMSIRFHDRQPPDDGCVLEVSYIRSAAEGSRISLVEFLRGVLEQAGSGTNATGEIIYQSRPDLEIAWTEHAFVDVGERREAILRTCLARGQDVQALITFAFWPEDSERYAPVWNEALRTLQLGIYVDDLAQRVLH